MLGCIACANSVRKSSFWLRLKADLHARLPSTGQTTLHVTAALGDLGVLRVLKVRQPHFISKPASEDKLHEAFTCQFGLCFFSKQLLCSPFLDRSNCQYFIVCLFRLLELSWKQQTLLAILRCTWHVMQGT